MLFRITFTSLLSPEWETIVASNTFSFSEWEEWAGRIVLILIKCLEC